MAASRLNPEQVVRWIGELREGIQRHRRRRKISPEERLAFLSQQYHHLYLLNRAIEGRVVFVGAPPIGESQ